MIEVQLIDPAHQLEIVFTGGTRLIIQAAPTDLQEFGQTGKTQFVIAIRYFFALGNRPALSSAPSKTLFSSVSWPIFA